MSNQKRPNVIIFFTDQQRFDTAGVHGNPMGLTPNFDRMATEGTHFYNAFTPQPVCVPARLVLQTGQYASKNNTYSNKGGLPKGNNTLATHFKKAGYHTAYIGKWHICHPEGDELRVPEEYRKDYDYWLAANTLEKHTDAYNTSLFDKDGKEHYLPGYRVDAQTDAAIRYIHEKKDNNFFMMLSFLEPHFQNTRDDFPAPTGYEARYTDPWCPPDLRSLDGTAHRHLPGYYGMVKRLDEALGRLEDALRSLCILDNTIVLFTTDHGCHFKTRNAEYKRSCHDSSIRIPMAARGPGFEQGGQIRQIASLIDVPPTLLDACDIDIPAEMQGKSLLTCVNKTAENWPEEAYIEIGNHGTMERAIRTSRWTYCIRRTVSGENTGQDWNFEEAYLYDNKADPWQLENLINHQQYRHVADILRERIQQRMQDAGEKRPDKLIEAEITKTSGIRRFLRDDYIF